MRYYILSICLLLIIGGQTATSQTSRAVYLDYMEEAADATWERIPDIISDWKAAVDPSDLWGYNVTSTPVYLADLLSFLYKTTGKRIYAERAGQLLAEYGSLRDAYPEDYFMSRVEYENGVPLTSNFFFMPSLIRSYANLIDAGVWDDETAARLRDEVAHTLDFIFYFPEWGAHNRAMLRAEAWMYGAIAMPDHPNASQWRQMAENIATDNLHQWEVEDASGYHPIWLEAVYSYADASGEDDFQESPFMQYYSEYFKRLFSPADNIPDFGDANWNASLPRYLAVFERWGRDYHDAEARWIANRIFEKHFANRPATLGAAVSIMLAYEWMDESIVPQTPDVKSGDVLDDVVGKKTVFRTGWGEDDTYLLLNYRDEGDGGWVHREYLRNTISVEEEKMHHGHSDENSITLLMSDGAVLLHDGGYRDDLPSGPYGAYRADYFHNRMVVRSGKRDRYQTVEEYIRNSGAYDPVETKKLDFVSFEPFEMSRTRLENENKGYAWDRSIVFDKESNLFIVVDAVHILKTGYYTLTNLWHTQTIHERGSNYFVTSIDSIGTSTFDSDTRLLIQFPDTTARTIGSYEESRHYQTEQAIFQSEASHYRAGTWEVFTTILIPVQKGQDIQSSLNKVDVLSLDQLPQSIGFNITSEEHKAVVGLKIDLDSELHPENIRPRYTWELGKQKFGDFTTDAHFFFGVHDTDRIRYGASNVTRVYFGDQSLLEARPNAWGLQLDGSPDRVGSSKWRSWQDSVPVQQ